MMVLNQNWDGLGVGKKNDVKYLSNSYVSTHFICLHQGYKEIFNALKVYLLQKDFASNYDYEVMMPHNSYYCCVYNNNNFSNSITIHFGWRFMSYFHGMFCYYNRSPIISNYPQVFFLWCKKIIFIWDFGGREC